jgi:hypothetical protein
VLRTTALTPRIGLRFCCRNRIPADWAAVDFLTYLYLNNNDLTELGSIQFLEELYLQQNEIVGSVPDNLCSMVDDGNLVIRVDCLEITCRCCLCS